MISERFSRIASIFYGGVGENLGGVATRMTFPTTLQSIISELAIDGRRTDIWTYSMRYAILQGHTALQGRVD